MLQELPRPGAERLGIEQVVGCYHLRPFRLHNSPANYRFYGLCRIHLLKSRLGHKVVPDFGHTESIK